LKNPEERQSEEKEEKKYSHEIRDHFHDHKTFQKLCVNVKGSWPIQNKTGSFNQKHFIVFFGAEGSTHLHVKSCCYNHYYRLINVD